MARRGDVMDQQLDDLRERMRLLQQDRRANVDILDANKVANAEEVRNLRDENKELRLRLTKLKKLPGGASGGGGDRELVTLQREVLRLRSEYDSQKVVSVKLKAQLDRLKDEAKLCELEARRPSQEDSPLSRQIRMLENRLDKAMIKYNEAHSIRNTYEHISKRLKEERLSFDNQLTALERTLQSKQRDYEELLLLSGNANHAREVAQQDLQRSQQRYEERRLKRESEVKERHQVVKVRRLMIERHERRENKRKEIESGRSGAALTASTTSDDANENNIPTSLEDEESKMDVYESAFRKIKEATGVSDVNEVIHKIIGQESTTDHLLAQTKQNQARTEELLTLRETLKKTVEEEKYTGGSGGGGSGRSTGCWGRKTVDEKEEFLARSLSRLERCKGKYDRFASVFISVTAGVNHLKDKLETVREDVGVDQTTTESSSATESSSVTANSLKTAGVVLLRLQSQIDDVDNDDDNKGAAATLRPVFSEDDDDDDKNDDAAHRRPYNRRISLPSVRDVRAFDRDGHRWGAGKGFGGGEDGGGGISDGGCPTGSDDEFEELDGGEAELSRERVKKASSEIVMAQERRKAKGRRD